MAALSERLKEKHFNGREDRVVISLPIWTTFTDLYQACLVTLSLDGDGPRGLRAQKQLHP